MTASDEYATQQEVYDIIHAGIKDHDREITQLLKRVRGAIGREPHSWLDVACGTGLHLRALAKAGVNVLAGIDNSPTQIAVAKERLGSLAQVDLADMRDFQVDTPEGGFDVVSCLLSSVGHLESADDYVAALQCMALHMNPRGVMLLEPWIDAGDYTPGRVDVDVAKREGIQVARITKHLSDEDPAMSCLEFRFVVSRADSTVIDEWTTQMRLRMRTVEQQTAMFEQVFSRVEFQSTGAGSRGIFLARHPVQ